MVDEATVVCKYLIYGTDSVTERIVSSVFIDTKELLESGCGGFISTDPYQKEFMSLPTYNMPDVLKLENIEICIVNAEDFIIQRDHLVIGYSIDSKRIKSENWLILKKVSLKYYDTNDDEIIRLRHRILDCNENDDFLGYCTKSPMKYQVYWDSEYDMPFVIYEGKKIYYPRNQKFLTENGVQYVVGLEYEQQDDSPHLYLREQDEIKDNAVIVDAGVCEGNFAIRFIDRCSKLYLIEPSKDWYYPLRLTFKDYMNKVVFCTKYLSDKNDNYHITLDELLNGEKVDFIKMDVEGAEVEALIGAKKTFEISDLICSICSYHKHNDQKTIEKILNEYGYESNHSQGYMIYLNDPDKFKYCELRRGIVYGWKD